MTKLLKERVIRYKDNGMKYAYEQAQRRHLFRDDVLILSDQFLSSMDEMAKRDDRLLLFSLPDGKELWRAYRMVMFIDDTWGWSPMPDEETARLRALLLLQQ
jgi:hypothetical protein